MEFIYFPNGVKVSQDGKTICLPDGTAVKLGEDGDVLSAGKEKNIVDEKYPFTCFDFIGEKERSQVARHFAKGKKIYNNEHERRFYGVLAEAIVAVKYDYYLAKYPASVDSKGCIYYTEDANGAMGYSKEDWEAMAKQFCPKCNSDIATLYEYVIWIAYNILQKRWTLDTCCTENEVAGNDAFLHTRKLVRHKGELIRCGYNKHITRSPGRVPLKISYGGFEDFNLPIHYAYTAIVAMRP